MTTSTKYNWTPIVFLFFVTVLMILVGVAVWWLESRFGSSVALVAVAGVGGAALFVFGARFGRAAVQDGAKLANEAANNATYGVVDTVTGLQKANVAAINAQASTVKADNTIRVLDARQQYGQLSQMSKAAVQAYLEAQTHGAQLADSWDRQGDGEAGAGQQDGGVRYYD